jgi:pilus assembly protein CpaB
MPRRLLGILAAVLLAGIGTFTLVLYVRGAEERALAGEQLTPVHVVRTPVPAGTAADELGTVVEVEQVPVKVRAADAVTDLSALAGMVTAVDLIPGEQLLASRFVRPEDRPAGGVDVPAGLVEVTIELSPTRAVGGKLSPGDTVAVLSSFEPFELSGAHIEVDGQPIPIQLDGELAAGGKTPNTTHVIVQQVLVTAVQSAGKPPADGDGGQAPTGSLLVTLAVSPADAERVVFTAEFGSLWLAAETGEHVPGGTRIQSRASVHQGTGSVAQ